MGIKLPVRVASHPHAGQAVWSGLDEQDRGLAEPARPSPLAACTSPAQGAVCKPFRSPFPTSAPHLVLSRPTRIRRGCLPKSDGVLKRRDSSADEWHAVMAHRGEHRGDHGKPAHPRTDSGRDACATLRMLVLCSMDGHDVSICGSPPKQAAGKDRLPNCVGKARCFYSQWVLSFVTGSSGLDPDRGHLRTLSTCGFYLDGNDPNVSLSTIRAQS